MAIPQQQCQNWTKNPATMLQMSTHWQFISDISPMLVWWWLVIIVPILGRWTRLCWSNIGLPMLGEYCQFLVIVWVLWIWRIYKCCEFEEDPLKNMLCRLHKRQRQPPLWPQISLIGGDNVLGSRSWSNKQLVWIWKKIHYKLKGWEHTQEKQSCPPSATNVTKKWRKWIRV